MQHLLSFRCVLAATALCAELQGASASQLLNPIPVDLVVKRETILSAGFSPDGRWLATIIMRVGSPEGSDKIDAPRKVLTTRLQVLEVSSGRVVYAPPVSFPSDIFSWSPNGKMLAYDVQTKTGRNLWLWRADDNTTAPIGSVELGRSNIVWADNQTLIASVVHARMTAQEFETTESSESSTLEFKQPLRSDPNIVVYKSIPPKTGEIPSQDFVSNNRFRGDLARVSVKNGTLQFIAQGMRPQNLRVSPNGRWIAYVTVTREAEGNGYRHLLDLVVVPTDGSKAPRVISQGVESTNTLLDFSWSPDSSQIAYIGKSLQGNASSGMRADCFIISLRSGTTRRFQLNLDDARESITSAFRRPLWSTDSNAIFFINAGKLWRTDVAKETTNLWSEVPGRRFRQIVMPRHKDDVGTWSPDNRVIVITRDEETKGGAFYQVSLSNGRTRLLLEARANFDSSPEKVDVASLGQKIAYTQESCDSTEQLWVSNSNLHSRKKLTNLNADLNAYVLGQSQLISWKSIDGLLLQGSLLLPAGYKKGQRYPLVVQVYGGDRLSNGVNLFGGSSGLTMPVFNSQLLATRGFAVLEVDSYSRPGTAVADIAASVLPGIDMAIEMGIADSERIGLRGQSNGGYSALALIIQTNRFRAAVISAGFSNLFSMYGQMHPDGTNWAISWVERPDNMDSTPWEQRERYIQNSPFFFLDHVNTPVLIIHGAKDTAVQQHLADETFMALRRLGKEVEYVKYLNEGHVLLGDSNIKDAAERMIQWFDRYLK